MIDTLDDVQFADRSGLAQLYGLKLTGWSGKR